MSGLNDERAIHSLAAVTERHKSESFRLPGK